MMKTSKYMNEERIAWLKTQNNIPRKVIQQKFNERYSVDIPYRTMVWWLTKLGVSAPDSHFVSGHEPWNKGMDRDEYRTHFTDEQWEETIGRVLNAEHHRNKIGDVKVIRDSHGNREPWIVVRTGKGLTTYQKIEKLDRFIWEKRCGQIPDDCMVVHLNHNSLDCTADNLALIKKAWLGTFMYWMRSSDSEINKTTIMWLSLKDALKAQEEIE